MELTRGIWPRETALFPSPTQAAALLAGEGPVLSSHLRERGSWSLSPQTSAPGRCLSAYASNPTAPLLCSFAFCKARTCVSPCALPLSGGGGHSRDRGRAWTRWFRGPAFPAGHRTTFIEHDQPSAAEGENHFELHLPLSACSRGRRSPLFVLSFATGE